MPYVAVDTRSITAMNGSQGFVENDRFLDAREASRLSSQRLRSFRREQEPFHIRNENITTSRRRMSKQLSDFDSMFAAAAGNR